MGSFLDSSNFPPYVLQCNAKWVLKQNWRSYLTKHSQAQKGEFLPGSKARRGASYCKGPFFTWQPKDGSHTHVGVHTGLYMDLIVLIKSLEDSVKVVETQMERIQNYNSTRVKDGRFLFGHNIVDEARGGIFVLDASSAQPHSATDFIVHQLAQMLEFWCEFHLSSTCGYSATTPAVCGISSGGNR